MLRAWTDPEVFAWNGEHYQLRSVNLWPRPVQTPHPPLLVPGRAQRVDVGHVPRARLAVCLPELLRRERRRVGDGRLLGPRRRPRPGPQPVPRLVPAARRRGRHRRAGRGPLRPAPRVLLQEAPALPAALLHAAGLRGVRRPARRLQGDARVAAAGPQGAHRARHDRARLRGRRAARRRCATGWRRSRAASASGHLLAIMQFGSMPHELAERQHPAHGVGRPAAPADALGRGGLGDRGGRPARRRGPRHDGPHRRAAPLRLRGEGPRRRRRAAARVPAPGGAAPAGTRSSTRSPSATRSTRPTTPGRARPRATRSIGSPACGTSSSSTTSCSTPSGSTACRSWGRRSAAWWPARSPRTGAPRSRASSCSTRSACGATTRRSPST